MSDIGVIALVPDQWDAMWQARHHLLSRMAARCEVAWMSPGHHWRDALRESTRAELSPASRGCKYMMRRDGSRAFTEVHASMD